MSGRYRTLVVVVNVLIPLAAFLSPMRSLFTWGVVGLLLGMMLLVSLPTLVLSASFQARWKLHANVLSLLVFGVTVVVLTTVRSWMGA